MQTGPFGSQLHSDEYVENEIPLINPAHIIDGHIVPSANCTVDIDTQERLSRHKMQNGDLILARRGELGRCAVVREEHAGWLCGTGSLKATLCSTMRPDYAFMLISSEGVKIELSLESKGSTMENMNTETLGKIRLPVPPIIEQDQILLFVSEMAGKYDRLQGLATKQIDFLQERRTALISAAVTGKIDVRNWQPAQSKPPMEASA
jgi:type I restriction enzyme S subunit